MLWQVSSLQRVRYCGRVMRSTSAGVTMRASNGVAGYAGLQHCGSVWACPVCSAAIRRERSVEIGSVLGQAVAEGHVLAFQTLTMRHREGQPLRQLWRAAQRAWTAATSGKQWAAAQLDHGVVGWVRVWEVTHGRNGWHVHVHLVLVLDVGRGAADLDAVAAGLYGRWSRALQREGLDAPQLVGQDWHMAEGDRASVELGRYLTKLADDGGSVEGLAESLGMELTYSAPGRARRELATQPVWSLLSELHETGDVEQLNRWREWEMGSKGKRMVGWSKGLRERFAPAMPELSDDEIADREVGSAADDVVRITAEGWQQLVRQPAVMVELLEVLEGGGERGLAARLDELGVAYELIHHPDGHSHG